MPKEVVKHINGGLIIDANRLINGSPLQIGGDAAVANAFGD